MPSLITGEPHGGGWLDLGVHLARMFEVLNTPRDGRQAIWTNCWPICPTSTRAVRGATGFAEFNRDMRNSLLACTRFDWSRISPAVFGSLFQAVMEPKERRQIGGITRRNATSCSVDLSPHAAYSRDPGVTSVPHVRRRAARPA